MAYNRTNWQDLPNQTTPINATNLNKIEQGIYDATYVNGVNVGSSVDSDYKVNFIKGKNLMQIKTIASTTISGITYSISNDGTITLNGTANARMEFSYLLEPLKSFANEYYCLSYIYISGALTDGSVSVNNQDGNHNLNGYNIELTTSNYSSNKGDLKSMQTDLNMNGAAIIRVGNGSVLNNLKFKLMFVKSRVRDYNYEPYIASSINVDGYKFTETLGVGTSVDSKNRVNMLHSKNLFNYKIPSTTSFGITFSMINGVMTLNGTTTELGDIYTTANNRILLKAGTYTISATKISGWFNAQSRDTGIYIRKDSDNSALFTLLSSDNYTKTSTLTLNADTLVKISIYTNGSGMQFSNMTINLQIEKGSTATKFEIPVTPSINVDGEEIYSKDNLEQYSTSEIKIGTWIDGKPLYRKVFNYNNPTADSILGNSGITPANVAKIDALGTQANNNVGGRIPLGYRGFGVQINANGEFYYTNPNYTFSNLSITVEYTKTTDTATRSLNAIEQTRSIPTESTEDDER